MKDKIKEEVLKERQQPDQPIGEYTTGAKCECGHTYKFHNKLGILSRG